jgi:hypothetical protein
MKSKCMKIVISHLKPNNSTKYQFQSSRERVQNYTYIRKFVMFLNMLMTGSFDWVVIRKIIREKYRLINRISSTILESMLLQKECSKSI